MVVGASGVVSTVLALGCGIPYLRSVLSGRTLPHQFSWLIFVIINGIATVGQLLAGGRWSVLISSTFFVYSLVILGLAMTRGLRDTSPADRLLLVLCVATLVAWAMTRNSVLAIWLSVLLDLMATAMTILKIRVSPRSEDPLPWTLGAVAYVFACAALAQTPFGALYLRPIYGLLSDAAIAIAVLWFGRARPPQTLWREG